MLLITLTNINKCDTFKLALKSIYRAEFVVQMARERKMKKIFQGIFSAIAIIVIATTFAMTVLEVKPSSFASDFVTQHGE